MAVFELLTVALTVVLLWQLHARLKEPAP